MATKVKPLATVSKTDSVFDCPRCSGKGWLLEFRHIKGGICFLCAGNKTITLKESYPKKGSFYCENRVGRIQVPHPKVKGVWVPKEVSYLSIYWAEPNGSQFPVVYREITPENRDELAALWFQAKADGINCSQRDFCTNELIKQY